MTPTQQALEALRDLCAMNAHDVHEGLSKYAKGSATDKMWKRARAAITSLEAAPAAPEFADKTITAREVARRTGLDTRRSGIAGL